MKLVWLPKAILERDAQLDFIAKDSPKASIEQGDEIEKQTDMLLEHPEIGRLGRRKGTREFERHSSLCIGLSRVLDASRCCGCCTDRSSGQKGSFDEKSGKVC